MFLSTGDTQRFIGYSRWFLKLPQDLANMHNEMLTAREKAAINCKINNSNFELLDETKDLHASPLLLGELKSIKSIKSTKHPNARAPLPRLPGLIALLTHFISAGPQGEPCRVEDFN